MNQQKINDVNRSLALPLLRRMRLARVFSPRTTRRPSTPWRRERMQVPLNFVMHWLRLGLGALGSRRNVIATQQRMGLVREVSSSSSSSSHLDPARETAVVMALGAGGILGCAYVIAQTDYWENERKKRQEIEKNKAE